MSTDRLSKFKNLWLFGIKGLFVDNLGKNRQEPYGYFG